MKFQTMTAHIQFLMLRKKDLNHVIEKNLNMNNYISDFKKLPTNLVYAFDEPGDQIDVLNNLINQCISDYAPTKKVKFTCPPAPWMEDPEIINAS